MAGAWTLAEYPAMTPLYKGILDLQKKVADNTAVDTIDMSTIKHSAPNLASKTFELDRPITALGIVAQKEAYDTIRAHDRLCTMFFRDRAYYYAEASSQLDKDKAMFDYEEAVLDKYLQHGS